MSKSSANSPKKSSHELTSRNSFHLHLFLNLSIKKIAPRFEYPLFNPLTVPRLLVSFEESMKPINRNIELIGVRQNNLKNIHVSLPARKISVITGLSGSGKSSLAFDTLYAEGQRRYVESLSTYTRQFLDKMPKPDVDTIKNIPPAIALEQRNTILNSRSTVGTQTEIIDYLRLLFASIGETFCIECGTRVEKIDAQVILQWAKKELPGKKILLTAPLIAWKPKKTSAKKTTQTLLQALQEQGYRRVLWKTSLIDLDDNTEDGLDRIPWTAIEREELLVVVDRVKFSSHETMTDPDTQTRLLDSIEQCLKISHGRILFFNSDDKSKKRFDTRFACPSCGKEHPLPEPQLFSFNSPLGACSRCNGFGHTLELDERLIVPDPNKTLKNGAIDPFSKPSYQEWQRDLFRFAERHGISIGKRYRDLNAAEKKLLWNGDPKDSTFPGIIACFEEMKKWKYKIHVRVFVRRYQKQSLCPECEGSRIQRSSRAVRIRNRNLPEVLDLPISETLDWLTHSAFSPTESKKSGELIPQIHRRLELLQEVGLGYLTLSRLSKTLSGGEFQRVNLATQLGSGLCGTLYVLDEPSIGLHAADTDRLIRILKKLRDQGNTVVIVEHDLEVMRHADYFVEVGPGAGHRGGEIIVQGNAQTLMQAPGSLTGKYLSGAFSIDRVHSPRGEHHHSLVLSECSEHNLKNITVEFPLQRLVVVTGVSGSGKSTLVHHTLYQALAQKFHGSIEVPGRHKKISGYESLNNVMLMDQSPIGKSSRSNPATYLKAWDEIRKIYSRQSLAIRRGYTPQYFSFNVDGGRCPVCKGDGEIVLDMHFMAEVRIPCEECEGRRFKKSILDVTYRGKNVDQLLKTTLDEAYEIFSDSPILQKKLSILREVGLGYLQLGQPAPTLSGGESQRLKIAATLDEKKSGSILYIFDEPTTGLHMEDIKKLMGVIQDLVDAKHSVVLIEHHLDVIKQADWIIDLGPEGGKNGGHLLAAGPPALLRHKLQSITGKALRELCPND